MSVKVAKMGGGPAAWPYVEHMARWERRQLFLRSYRFSRDADASRSRSRVVWAGLRRTAAKGLRRFRARLRLCFGWTATRRRSPRGGRAGATGFFRYGRLYYYGARKAVCLC